MLVITIERIMKMKNIKNKFYKIVALVLCISLLGSSTIGAFADTNSNSIPTRIVETFILEGEEYTLETNVYSEKIIATVYNSNNTIESQYVNNVLSSEPDTLYVEEMDLNGYYEIVRPCAEPNYKLISTTNGSLKPAAWTTVAVIAAIAALNPGAGAAAIASLASAIISDAGDSYTYKMLTYTASDNTFFYQKTVFKIYNKETGKKVGPDLVTKVKTRHK